jgi:drug/metabolite transporter (DMT)-like permease
MYSIHVALVITAMVLTGATRSVCVKLFYQLGFERPEVVTFLYLLGQFLSIVVYLVSRVLGALFVGSLDSSLKGNNGSVEMENITTETESSSEHFKDHAEEASLEENHSPVVAYKKIRSPLFRAENRLQVYDVLPHRASDDSGMQEKESPLDGEQTQQQKDRLSGSRHGLTEESDQAISWVHSIPWYLKPLIPALFNLCNAFMRWASLLYTAASIAEMLISGMELVLSVLATRCIRKRKISPFRWAGIGVVTVGLLVVGTSHLLHSHNKEEDGTGNDSAVDGSIIGLLLIVGQCIMSVMQDTAEEVFIQASDFPPTLLLGMEGFFGIIIGSILWALIQPPPQLDDLTVGYPYMISLTLLFTVTGIFNIMATGVTSSVTRNVWKNLRTLLVWAAGLIIYYSVGNVDVGEAWVVPDSFIALLGFMIILSGVHVYYMTKRPASLYLFGFVSYGRVLS